MSRLDAIFNRRRLILTVALLTSLTGLGLWLTMDRQEDPRMPAYWGQVVVTYPGADAELVERLVLEPVEDALAEVEQVHAVTSTAYSEAAVVKIDLDERTDDTDKAWDEVREALATASLEFPAGAGQPMLNAKLNTDHDAVVVALTGSSDPLTLLTAARTLRQALLDVPMVARVKIVGDPGEQITVELDDAAARRLGVTGPQLAAQLGGRAQILPGGSLALGDRTVRLRPQSEMESVAEIAATPIRVGSGATVPLAEIARVRMSPREPAGQRMRLDGTTAVGVAVVAKDDVNAVRFGDAIRTRLAEIEPSLAPVEMQVIAFQPDRVEGRLAELNQSLLLGILIVAGVVILAMGLRLGLVVASVVPLVTFAALAVFAIGGGVLHQISIAALVLALGMLVDNAIVVAENVQWRLDRGAVPRDAATAAVRELAVPLAAATATTIAAFLPMLLADSGTADFTRTIPVMVILTLTISYLFAILVTPILSEMSLVPGSSRSTAFTSRHAAIATRLALRRGGWVLAAAMVLVTVSAVGAGAVRQQFFPAADRNQLVVDLKLPEGAHLDATDDATRTLERMLLERPEVQQVASFMGRGAPRFYYNIQSVPWSPHFAQLMVTTRATADVDAVLDWVRTESPTRLPGIEVIGRPLEQGPPVAAPVELRLFSDNLDDLHHTATAVAAVLRDTPGTADVRHDMGAGEPTLHIVVDDAAAARRGLSRADVARALAGHTRGWPVGELRSGDDPVPIVVRSSAGENTTPESLDGLDVATPAGGAVPLAQVARIDAGWRPAAIHHRNRARMVTVASQLTGGATFSDVLRAAAPALGALEQPPGTRLAFGGDAEGAGEANAALLKTLPIGLLMLLAVLLAEFDSFRRVGLILVTVPLAATGVVPGLLISGQPFGFMSLLGVFALIGIVVNNAIVLLEVTDSRRRDGATVDEALTDAIEQRIRPILLTTTTTVAGLLPLALSASTLWPPLAWAMISGLIASTALTLVVVPALYRMLLGRPERAARRRLRVAPTATGIILLLGLAGTVGADTGAITLDLTEAMRLATQRPAVGAADRRAEAIAEAGLANRRLSYLPVIGGSYTESDRDRDLELVTPIGAFSFGASRSRSAGVELLQPLFDPSRVLHGNAASRLETEAAGAAALRSRQQLAAEAADAWLRLQSVDARIAATHSFVDSLSARLQETEARVTGGRALEADALKIRLDLESAELDQVRLREARAVTVANLARVTGTVGAVAATAAPDWSERPVPEAANLTETAVAARPDLRALERTGEALERRRAAIRAEAIPRLDARIAWSWTDGSPYQVDSWTEGALVVSWSPFAAGTRGPRAAAAAAERDAARADLAEARRSLEIEIRSAVAGLVTAREAIEVRRRGVEQATETLRVEGERHAAGRVTTNDLLAAEATLRDQRTRLELARLEIVRAWVAIWLTVGNDDPAWLAEPAS
jgi:multidrug efflux pump subunit AcrB/outer membrane protein TolC